MVILLKCFELLQEKSKPWDVFKKSIHLIYCQNAMMIWLYCHHAQNVNPQSGVALIESPSLTLNPLISRVLKQSYVANYQNQLTFALSKQTSLPS
jgi:hypothetical protein